MFGKLFATVAVLSSVSIAQANPDVRCGGQIGPSFSMHPVPSLVLKGLASEVVIASHDGVTVTVDRVGLGEDTSIASIVMKAPGLAEVSTSGDAKDVVQLQGSIQGKTGFVMYSIMCKNLPKK